MSPPGGRRTFQSLHTRNYRLFFFGQLVSNTGNWLTNIALTLLVLHLTNRGLPVGALSAAQYGPILLLSPWAGAIADRSDKRHLLFVTQSLEMAQSVALAVLAFMRHPPLVALFAAATAGGILLAFDNPLRRSFVGEMVPGEDLPNAVALYSALVNISRMFGPALAGLLVVTVGFGWCFTIDALSYLVVLAALGLMRPAELHRAPPVPREQGAVRAGLRYLGRTPNLRIAFVMLAFVGVLSYNMNVQLPLFVEQALHRGDAAFTIMYAAYSAGGLVSALLVARRSMVRLQHVVIGALALGATLLTLGTAPNIGVGLPLAFLTGVASIVYTTSTTAIVQLEAEPSMHGRLLALQTVCMVGSGLIGGPFVGAVADALGARAPLVVGGAAALAAGAWGAMAARRARMPAGEG